MNDKHSGIVGIVDDDPAVLDSLKFLLEVVGYQVSTYASAFAFLGNGADPACLIIDQHMPGMTGLELAQKLRDDHDAIPILLITGSPSPAIVARAAQLGIVKVLEKPPEEGDLLNFVGAYL
jgi:two-component system, LuxR family, response regulator FixJ